MGNKITHATKKFVEDNRLAYEKKELIVSATNPPVAEFNGKVSAGDTIYVELTTANGATYSTTTVVPEDYAELFSGMAGISSDQVFGNQEDDIVTVSKVVIKTIEDKFIPDTVARKSDITNNNSAETIPVLPVGTTFTDGFANSDEKKVCVLKKGTYFVRQGLPLEIEDQCICFVKINEWDGCLEITTITYDKVMTNNIFFDSDSASMEDGYVFPLIWWELCDKLLDLTHTELSHLWLMSPSGTPYMVTVDDDGTLKATSQDDIV